MGYYSALKKKRTTDACGSMGEFQKHATQKEPDAKAHVQHNSVYMKLCSGKKITTVFASVRVEADWEGA